MTKQIRWLPRCLEFAINVLPRISKHTLTVIKILSIDLAFQSMIPSFQLSLRLKTFANVSITLNINQCCPTRRHKSEYRNLGLSWLSIVKFSRPCCIKSLNLLQMISLMTKRDEGVHILVVALSNHLPSIFKFATDTFTLRIPLQKVRSSFEKIVLLIDDYANKLFTT